MKFAVWYQNKGVQQVIAVVGTIVMISTLLIAVDPKPFLKLGYPGIFLYSIFGTGTIIVPLLARYMNLYLLATFSSLGMAMHDCLAWLVGRSGQAIVPHNKNVDRIEEGVRKYGVVAIFFWALIPFPYEIVGIIAGYLNLTFWKFWLATFFGRAVRFFLLGEGALIVLRLR